MKIADSIIYATKIGEPRNYDVAHFFGDNEVYGNCTYVHV